MAIHALVILASQPQTQLPQTVLTVHNQRRPSSTSQHTKGVGGCSPADLNRARQGPGPWERHTQCPGRGTSRLRSHSQPPLGWQRLPAAPICLAGHSGLACDCRSGRTRIRLQIGRHCEVPCKQLTPGSTSFGKFAAWCKCRPMHISNSWRGMYEMKFTRRLRILKRTGPASHAGSEVSGRRPIDISLHLRLCLWQPSRLETLWIHACTQLPTTIKPVGPAV